MLAQVTSGGSSSCKVWEAAAKSPASRKNACMFGHTYAQMCAAQRDAARRHAGVYCIVLNSLKLDVRARHVSVLRLAVKVTGLHQAKTVRHHNAYLMGLVKNKGLNILYRDYIGILCSLFPS